MSAPQIIEAKRLERGSWASTLKNSRACTNLLHFLWRPLCPDPTPFFKFPFSVCKDSIIASIPRALQVLIQDWGEISSNNVFKGSFDVRAHIMKLPCHRFHSKKLLYLNIHQIVCNIYRAAGQYVLKLTLRYLWKGLK